MPPEQTRAGHRRFYPLYHFIVVPILVANFIARIVYAYRYPSKLNYWEILIALVLVLFALVARIMTLSVQDRVIRLEETLRLQRCLPDELRGRIGELSTGQLIGMRFCSDAELPELTRTVLDDKVYGREDIKKRIKSWRPDVAPRA
jgi:hypothetical protein